MNRVSRTVSQALRLGLMIRMTGTASFILAATLTLSACSNETVPPPGATDAETRFEATFDPGDASFVLSQVSSRPGFEVELLGSNLTTDATAGTVSLDVAVRNVSEREIAEPAKIWLDQFRPQSVTVTNADFVEPAPDDAGDVPARFGFDYAGSFGADEVLSPNEISTARTWVFSVPDMSSFSFSALADVATSLESRLGGMIFQDLNESGTREADEPPFFGRIIVTRPDGSQVRTATNDEGKYSVPVYESGLHLVAYEPPDLDCVCFVTVTTSNPIEVVLVPGNNGVPQDYLEADFGAHIANLDEPEPIVLTDRQPDDILRDPYRFMEASLDGDILTLRVEFGGCGPDHDFGLFMTGGFMESLPVQARIVLSHDDFDEECDAVFQRVLRFDLRPLRAAYEESYGDSGPIVLRLTDPNGQEHEFRYVLATPPPPPGNLLRNGSFELNGEPSDAGWELRNPDLATLVRPGAPENGRFALRLDSDGAPTNGTARAFVPGAERGARYSVFAWIRAEGDHGGGAVYLTTGRWMSQPVEVTSTEWTRVSFETEVPEIADGGLWLVLSSLVTEIAPRVGVFDGVVVQRIR